MYRDAGKLIFWRRMAPKLKTMANDDSLKELKKKLKLKNKQEKGRESDNNSNLGQKLKKHKPQLTNVSQKCRLMKVSQRGAAFLGWPILARET